MDIGAAIDGVAARSHGFRVTLRGFDAFSKLRRARVAFLRVTTGVDELCALAADLRLALPAAFRPAEGRRFRAHLTVARFRQAPPEGALQRVAEAFEAGGEWSFRVDSIQLVRSELSTAGARYSTLHTARLAAPGNPL
jgi:2'-5' RNA ligase